MVALAEGAAAHQRDVNGFEETGSDHVEAGAGFIGLGNGVVEQVERNGPAIVDEGERERAGGGGYTGQRPQARDQVMDEAILLVRLVGSLGKIEAGG